MNIFPSEKKSDFWKETEKETLKEEQNIISKKK